MYAFGYINSGSINPPTPEVPSLSNLLLSGCSEKQFNGYYGNNSTDDQPVGPWGVFYKLNDSGEVQTNSEYIFLSQDRWMIGINSSSQDISWQERYQSTFQANVTTGQYQHPWGQSYEKTSNVSDDIDASGIQIELVSSLKSKYMKYPEVGDVILLTLPKFGINQVEFTYNDDIYLSQPATCSCSYSDASGNTLNINAVNYGNFNMSFISADDTDTFDLVQGNDLVGQFWNALGAQNKVLWSDTISYGSTEYAEGFEAFTVIHKPNQ